MGNFRNIIFFMIIAAILATSCASRKEIVQFKEDAVYIRTQVDLLQYNDELTKKEISELDNSIKSLQDDIRIMKADLLSEVSSVKDKTDFLDTKLDDASYRMKRMIDNVEDISGNNVVIDSSITPAPGAEKYGQTGTGRQQLYNSAYLDVAAGNYELALQGFLEYLKQFPNGELANNSQYWIGEIYYAQGDYNRALVEFKKVITNYDRGSKAPAALLKMGYCSINLGDVPTAKKHLSSLIKIFPNSEEVLLAQNKLEELN